MEFDIHTKARFIDEYTSEEYLPDRKKYLNHLAQIDFYKAKTLLKYFGDSFFHDAKVEHLKIDPEKRAIEFSVYTANDLEDINEFRQKHSLQKITWRNYKKNPLIYKCVFHGVSSFGGNFEIDEALTIIDSELHQGDLKNEFRVLVSFSETEEIEFSCRTCSVKIINQEQVLKYTGGLRKSVPYCENCRSKLTTIKVLEKSMRGRS